MAAQGFHVGDQVGRRVGGDCGVRGRAAAAALVEENDVVVTGVEEAAVKGGTAGTRAAMQIDDRLALGIAGLLPIDPVTSVAVQHALGEGLDGRKQGVDPMVHALSPGFSRVLPTLRGHDRKGEFGRDGACLFHEMEAISHCFPMVV